MITSNTGEILKFSSSPKQIKNIAMRVITLLQDYPKGDIVVSIAILWLQLCDRFNIDPKYILGVAQKIRTETYDNKHDSQFRAIKDYFENEI